jgi:hypothetical protein
MSSSSALYSTANAAVSGTTWLAVAVLLAWGGSEAVAVSSSSSAKPPVEIKATLHEGQVIVVSVARRGVPDNLWIGGTYRSGERRRAVILDALFHTQGTKTAELREVLAKRVLNPTDQGLEEEEKRLSEQLEMLVDGLRQMLAEKINSTTIHDELYFCVRLFLSLLRDIGGSTKGYRN